MTLDGETLLVGLILVACVAYLLRHAARALGMGGNRKGACNGCRRQCPSGGIKTESK